MGLPLAIVGAVGVLLGWLILDNGPPPASEKQATTAFVLILVSGVFLTLALLVGID